MGPTEIITDWIAWQRAAGIAETTRNARREVLDLFVRRTGVDPLTCDWRPVARFLAHDTIGPSTRRTYYSRLRSWFGWLCDIADVRTDNPMSKLKPPRVPRARPRPVSGATLAAVLNATMYRKTRAMILLGSVQGMRCMEIAAMRGDWIDDGWVHVHGKGGVVRRLPLHPAVAALAPDFPDGLWFPSWKYPDTHVLPRSVSHNIGLTMRRAGVHGTAHQLRHWYGTQTLVIAKNARVTQELLGHSDLATVAIYTLVEDGLLREAVDGLPLPRYQSRSRRAA